MKAVTAPLPLFLLLDSGMVGVVENAGWEDGGR